MMKLNFEINTDVTVVDLPEREPRTSSVGVNVYGDAHSRSNSLEYQFTPRRVSLDEAELRRITRSRSNLERVPIETTPLKNTERESFTPPDSPPH